MRLVLDTNVVVSAMMYGGLPARLWDLAGTGTISLFTSDALVAELKETLAKPKFARQLAAARTAPDGLAAQYLAVARLVAAPPIPPVVRDDPDDDAVLACAIAARAEAVVSGDAHLLALRKYRGVPILSVSEAVARVQSSPSPS